jgi:hypothetical protein
VISIVHRLIKFDRTLSSSHFLLQAVIGAWVTRDAFAEHHIIASVTPFLANRLSPACDISSLKEGPPNVELQQGSRACQYGRQGQDHTCDTEFEYLLGLTDAVRM